MASNQAENSRRRRSTLTLAKGLQSEKILEEPNLEAIAAKQLGLDRPESERNGHRSRLHAEQLSAPELGTSMLFLGQCESLGRKHQPSCAKSSTS